MVHRRSRESYERRLREWKDWEDWKAEQDLPRRIVLDYSYHDIENRDVVFTEKFLEIVDKKLKAQYNGGVPMHAYDDLEFGDILNRFPLRVQRSLNMIPYRLWPILGIQQ